MPLDPVYPTQLHYTGSPTTWSINPTSFNICEPTTPTTKSYPSNLIDTSYPTKISHLPNKPPSRKFQFIDQTLTTQIESSETSQNIPPLCKNGSHDRAISLDKTRTAQQRRRDKRVNIIRNEVADRLEDLEKQLQEKEVICGSLRNTLNQKDRELESLKQQFQQLMAQRNQTAFLHYPTQFAQTPQSLQTTSRNFVLIPSPNPAVYHNRKPFMEKIDYSKIQLRKTEQLDEEKKGVISMQQEWEERQRLQEFISKVEQEANWRAFQLQQQQVPPVASPYYGGAPSNIYPETQNKVGNLPVSAFTTKVDISNKRQELQKQTVGSLEQLLLADQNDSFDEGQVRIMQQSDDLFNRVTKSGDYLHLPNIKKEETY